MVVVLGLGFSDEDIMKLAERLNPVIKDYCSDYDEVVYHALPGHTFVYDRHDSKLAILPKNASVIILGLKTKINDNTRWEFSNKLVSVLQGATLSIF